jgi:hypothetical protein
MKLRQIIIWSVFAVFMLTSIVIAGTIGFIDIGLDKDTSDKATDIIAEKKISEEQFVKESVENNIQQYENTKKAELRRRLMQETSLCSRGTIEQMQSCLTAIQTVNNGYKVTVPVEEQVIP